jgi:plasmid stabilization system protein ParE
MRIRWTDSAVRDFTHICDYIESIIAAPLHHVLPFLFTSRLICWRSSRSTEEQVENPTHASLCLPGYRIFAIYRIREDAVEIVRLLHGAQEWP